MNKRRITIIISLMILALLACESATSPELGFSSTPLPSSDDSQVAAYAAAQATLVAGQREIAALSHQATAVSLEINQAANIAAQATIDYHERQLMELSIRSTAVSQAMDQAAANQQAIMEQTQMALDATVTNESQAATATAQSQAATAAIESLAATATAQSQAASATTESQAATATYSAYILNVTQTAQAQVILDTQTTGTAQARATLTAYPLTATPEAAFQADIAQARDERERQAWWEDFVATPLRTLLLALVVLVLITGAVIAFRRLMPALEFRLRNPRGIEITRPLFPMAGLIVELEPRPHQLTQQDVHLHKNTQLPDDEIPQVEIISPSEPAIVNWIIEAERKLLTDGWRLS